MKLTKILLHLCLFTVVVCATIITIAGCSDDETVTPPTVQPITDDLFPLIVGHKITYTGFLRHQTADTNITATGAVYQTTWTVASNSTPTPLGVSANLVLDSTRVPTGIPSPPTITIFTPLFIQRNPPTGSANFSFATNIGRFYRTFAIQRTDSLKWILIAKLDAGIGAEWTAFDSTYTGASGPVRLQIVGKFEGKETLTLAGQTFDTYKATTKRNVYLGGSTTPSVTSPTATLWLVKDIGPVKMILNADGESYGHYREFKSKSF